MDSSNKGSDYKDIISEMENKGIKPIKAMPKHQLDYLIHNSPMMAKFDFCYRVTHEPYCVFGVYNFLEDVACDYYMTKDDYEDIVREIGNT